MSILTVRRLTVPIKSPADGTKSSRFRLPPGAMVDALEVELHVLDVDDAVLYVDTSNAEINRLSGTLSARATFNSYGVALVFMHPRHGELRFECATYSNAYHNVYAIAKTLFSLRRIDDWGATRGEQFAGFGRIPARTGATMTSTSAAEVLGRHAVMDTTKILTQKLIAKEAIRRAKAKTHPDTKGGNTGDFTTVGVAEQVIIAHHGGAL